MTKRILAVMMGLALAGSATAMDHSKMKKGMDHGEMKKGMDHNEMKGGMDHSAHLGDDIRDTKVDGYQLSYHLIDMEEKMESMKGMKGMSMKDHDMSKMASHHLMLYITGPNGKPVGEGKVGYKVTAPDGSDQKTMAMAMTGGFGADVDLKAKGSYTIKTKAVAGEAKLIDEFSYELK